MHPPYNTGNEGWVYNDNVKAPVIKEWLGKTVGKEGEDLTRHDKWLCMMMPRLKLLKELLTEDGVIFLSIDDNEQANLKLLMDEVFGEQNFIGNFIKQSKVGGGSDSKYIVQEHEYAICFAKNISILPDFFTNHEDEYLKRYKEEDLIGKYFWDTFARPGLSSPINYDITAPDGSIINGDWIRSKTRFEKDLQDEEIRFVQKKDKSWSIQFKQRLNQDGKKPRSMTMNFGGTIEGKNDVKEIFNDEKIFNYPKSVAYIKQLISVATNPGDIILDSFAGSGTTAQAVLELNKEDGGNRKFILVEMEEYANTITAERVRRVIKGVPNSKKEYLKAGLGGDFSYFQLGSAIEMEGLLEGNNLPSWIEMARYLYYTSTGEQWDESSIKGIDPTKSNTPIKIGSSNHYEVYMMYQPDIAWLKNNALTLDMVRAMKTPTDTKRNLIFGPSKYIDDDNLRLYKTLFQLLPYEIYKMDR
jgi:adenine-specific DNA-methyltransferase